MISIAGFDYRERIIAQKSHRNITKLMVIGSSNRMYDKIKFSDTIHTYTVTFNHIY